MAEKKSYKKTENKSDNKSVNYVNRELSWLEFNKRVLGEARDKEIKLFERLTLLDIFAKICSLKKRCQRFPISCIACPF